MGVREFKAFGSGRGLKDGKLSAVLPGLLSRGQGFFETAEDDLACGGLLFR